MRETYKAPGKRRSVGEGELERVVNPERNRRRRLFNELWLLLAALFAVAAILFRQRTLLVAPLLFLTVLGMARLWERNVFRSVAYRRVLSPRRAFIGETIELTVEVDNRKLLPVGWLSLAEIIPYGLTLLSGMSLPGGRASSNELYDVFALRWYERLRKRYQIHCWKRGYFRLGPARFSSGDVFGIFKAHAVDQHRDWLIVYPKVYPVEELRLPAMDPFGDFKAQERIFEDPLSIIGVRDYQHRDSFRRIHWKATARRQRLQSKVYESTVSHNLVLFLNIAVFDRPWQGTVPEVLERLISIAASLANYGIEQRYAVGVVVNSSVPNSQQNIKVPPGRSPQQLTRILEALAAVTPVANSSIERLLTAESPKLPQGSTLALVTAGVSESLAATLLHLSQAGRRIVLVTLSESLPDRLLYQHVLAYHLPAERLAFQRMKLPDDEGAS
jgi:uncharacterized protein (DUF58 family)